MSSCRRCSASSCLSSCDLNTSEDNPDAEDGSGASGPSTSKGLAGVFVVDLDIRCLGAWDLELEASTWLFFALGRGEAPEEVEESTGRLRLFSVTALDDEEDWGGGASFNKNPRVALWLVSVLPDACPRSFSRASSRASSR